jgi:hypothetical protein
LVFLFFLSACGNSHDQPGDAGSGGGDTPADSPADSPSDAGTLSSTGGANRIAIAGSYDFNIPWIQIYDLP